MSITNTNTARGNLSENLLHKIFLSWNIRNLQYLKKIDIYFPYLGVGISSSAGGGIASRTKSRKYLRQEDSQDLGNQVNVELHILCIYIFINYDHLFSSIVVYWLSSSR